MPPTVITRSTWTDDDGSGTTGTILNNAALQTDIYARIDALFTAAAGLACGGPVAERGRLTPMGEWVSPAYNAANFSATGGTWNVTAGNALAYGYAIIGKTVSLLVNIAASAIVGTPSNLILKLPGGLVPAQAIYGGLYGFSGAGVWVMGGYSAAAGSPNLTLYPTVGQSGTFAATSTFYMTLMLTYQTSTLVSLLEARETDGPVA